MERSERLVELTTVTIENPAEAQAAAATVARLTTPEWLEDFFGGGAVCSLAMDALADENKDLAEAIATYLGCMAEKIASDFGGGDHSGCDAEAGNMRAAAHEVDVAAMNAEIACGSLFN